MKILPLTVSPIKCYEYLEEENTFLLESGELTRESRYTIMGKAEGIVSMKDGKLRVKSFSEFSDQIKDLEGSYSCPLEALNLVRDRLKEKVNYKNLKDLRFKGGLVGYLSYDIVRYWIDLEEKEETIKFPDMEFFIVKDFIAFDLKGEKIYLVGEDERILEEAKKYKREYKVETNKIEFKSNVNKEKFMEMVERAKEYIYAGDIFQVVLSRKILFDCEGLDPFLIYKKVREINPSPYMYYLNFGERKIIGSSPEILVKTEMRGNKKYVITKPIAGTIRRGRDEKEDKELEKILLNDEKERAEHVMLVDLGRNDIGKISKFGTVKVTEFMKIEKYSHVQHIVSKVEGEIKDKYNSFMAVKATFPAGTLSGAPKVRAMEIINELEVDRRGPYGGGVGYFSWDDLMDLAITIRTYTISNNKGAIQVGAGIVSDSVPEKEWDETERKGMANVRAIRDLLC
ncbi:anthranilate synthase component I [Methanocaldococcus infernus ME]|uniref:Anthranilate synthase component 1 n=1 Tax=Methanocaldococcus infernus (strain DSM 11812 / JCM 15783 / ME) TaxID=573063 RepID=D5VT23_METIM|nr:anthranilate synthase component I [Methanocaldococcus infernus]ADG13726.1 anthranilate synthase component I [Methanocaldococcus infernus ME]